MRLYDTLRTAHLERAHRFQPATIIYRRKSYDFESQLSEGLDLIEANPLRTMILMLTSAVTICEINEPVMLSTTWKSAIVLAACDLRRIVGRPRTEIVLYAIENDNPFNYPISGRLRSRARRAAEKLLATLIWLRVDRVAFGTEASCQNYRRIFPPPRQRQSSATFPALPAADSRASSSGKDVDTVAFLGALAERKGLLVVLAAWPQVVNQHPNARLHIMGTGPLEVLATSAADGDATIRFDPNPPRSTIRAALLKAQVLALPSQPQPDWREQVGLPIVEGLAAGCTIVASSETGLAGWLRDHDHYVVDVPTNPDALAATIVAALGDRRPASTVLHALPELDGREAADLWLFRPSA